MKDFKTKNWGKDQFDFRSLEPKLEYRPVEFHLKEDGTLDNQPSLAIVMLHPHIQLSVIGQISVKMLADALDELGYKLEKK